MSNSAVTTGNGYLKDGGAFAETISLVVSHPIDEPNVLGGPGDPRSIWWHRIRSDEGTINIECTFAIATPIAVANDVRPLRMAKGLTAVVGDRDQHVAATEARVGAGAIRN